MSDAKIALLPLIHSFDGQALRAETDGEYVYATLEFPYGFNRALFHAEMTHLYNHGEVDHVIDGVEFGSCVLDIAFPINRYFL